MQPLCFAAFCVAAVLAESPSVGSYSSQGSSVRDYEYTSGRSGENYMAAKPTYNEFAGSYIAVTGSPHSKSDARYASISDSDSESGTSNGVSNGGSNSASNSGSGFYKAKYASEATINAIHPSYQNLAANSLPASASGASSEEATVQGPPNPAYSSIGSQTSSYYGSAYSDRGHEQQQQQQQQQQLHGTYSVTGSEPTGHSEYAPAPARPLHPVYAVNSHAGVYPHTRAGSYGSLFRGSSSVPSQTAIGDYSSGSRHHVHASYPVADEPYQGHHATSAQSPAVGSALHPYRSYIMSSPQSSYSSSKYQTVLGAIKSLFGAGGNSDPPTYLTASGPHGYYSPVAPVHSASHYAPAALMSPSVASPASSHYFSSGSSAVAYPKNSVYPPMRPMSNYGLNNGSPGISTAGKIILVRDGSAVLGPTNPSAANAAKNKISFSPSGSSYISAAPSSLSYSTAYSGSYPSSPTYPGAAHGGSTFLGYSAN